MDCVRLVDTSRRLHLTWTTSGTAYEKLSLEPGAYGREAAHKSPVLGRVQPARAATRYARNPFLERQIVRASGKAH